jgi:hypothetical protein
MWEDSVVVWQLLAVQAYSAVVHDQGIIITFWQGGVFFHLQSPYIFSLF